MFSILPLRLTLRAETLSLSFFSGPLWRSGLGLALQRHFPDVFDRCFAENARLGRLYALHPPTVPVMPGETFTLGLTLFGEAEKDAFAIMQGIDQLGQIGLGKDRGTFRLCAARVAGDGNGDFFDQNSGLARWPGALPVTHWLERTCGDCNAVEVSLSTPLRIKEANTLHRGPIPFELLVRRLHGRLAQLGEVIGKGCPLGHARVTAQLEQAKAVSLTGCQLQNQEIRRRSARSKQVMTVAGLSGQLAYRGNLAPFAGLLALGSVMQLGGKTAFGFGCLETRFLYED